MTYSSEKQELSFGQWLGFLAMTIGVFLAVLDIQIVASSIQQIQAGLSATLDEIAWIQTSYLIAEIIAIPLSGWLSRVFSTRYLYVISILGFTLASLGCAFAWNLPSMVVFRFIQGFLGGAVIPMTFTMIFVLFPPHLQPTANVILGMIITIPPTAGPIFGGYLTDTYSWQMLFLINLIPGFLVAIAVWMFVDIDRPAWHLLKKVDFLGIFLLAICLGCMQFVLEEGTRKQWFENQLIISLTIIAVTTGISFLIWELKNPHPIIDFKVFRNFNFSLGCIYSFVLGLGMFTIIYITPLYLANVKGLNSLQIGSYIMVMGIFQIVSALIAGVLEKTMDLRAILAIGFILLGSGTWLNGYMNLADGYWEFFLPQALRGLSMTLCFMPVSTLTLGLLPIEAINNASSLYNLVRNLGGAIGLAITSNLINYFNKAHYAVLRDNLTTTDYPLQLLLNKFDHNATQHQLFTPAITSLKQLTELTWQQAQVMTFNNLYQLIAIFFFAVVLLAPFLKKVSTSSTVAEH